MDPDGVATELGQRLAAIRTRMAAACRRAGRAPESVTLIGVSKTQPASLVLAAHLAGLADLGENRVQEAAAKASELPPTIRWHLIGPLQSNKARAAALLFSTIHSVDRPKIAHALDAEAGRLGRKLPCFLEVNLGEEESKHGFTARNLAAEAGPLADLRHLEIVGLMAIPPFADDPEASRPWFRRLRELGEELAGRALLPTFRGLLSMGMSHDFEVAIEEGATHVRVGTALFGHREVPEAAA